MIELIEFRRRILVHCFDSLLKSLNQQLAGDYSGNAP